MAKLQKIYSHYQSHIQTLGEHLESSGLYLEYLWDILKENRFTTYLIFVTKAILFLLFGSYFFKFMNLVLNRVSSIGWLETMKQVSLFLSKSLIQIIPPTINIFGLSLGIMAGYIVVSKLKQFHLTTNKSYSHLIRELQGLGIKGTHINGKLTYDWDQVLDSLYEKYLNASPTDVSIHRYKELYCFIQKHYDYLNRLATNNAVALNTDSNSGANI